MRVTSLLMQAASRATSGRFPAARSRAWNPRSTRSCRTALRAARQRAQRTLRRPGVAGVGLPLPMDGIGTGASEPCR